jgi:hypothetical protein
VAVNYKRLTSGSSDRGSRLRWAKERVDDWDKSASFVGGASPRRSTSSLDAISMSPQLRRRTSVVLAVIFALLGLYCAIWVFSSADLAFISCDNHYSLFSPIPRCRAPYIAIIASALFFLLAVCSIVFGRRASAADSANRNV